MRRAPILTRYGRRHADRPRPRPTSQMRVTSKIPSVHVAHVVLGPSQVRTLSLLGRSIAVHRIHQTLFVRSIVSFRSADAMEWTPDCPSCMVHPFRLEEYTGAVPQMFALRLPNAVKPADTHPEHRHPLRARSPHKQGFKQETLRKLPIGTRDTGKSQRPTW